MSTEETFGSKLKQMREDLLTIVVRMNRDGNHGIATAAQEAIRAVANIEDVSPSGWLTDLRWSWEPPEDLL